MVQEYIAVRHGLKVGDAIIPVGDVVPGAASFPTLRELVDGGWIAPQPVSVAQEAQKAPGGTDTPPVGQEAQNRAPEGESGQAGEPTTPTFDPSQHSIEEVIAYVEANIDELDTVIAAEKAGKKRKSLLAALEGS